MKSEEKSEKEKEKAPIDQECSVRPNRADNWSFDAADGRKGTIPSRQVRDEDQTAS